MPRPEVRPRSVARLYNTAARVWLVAAGLALLLPPRARLGAWLPLHLAVAGAVSVAISGSMQAFVSALTATPSPPQLLVGFQLAAVNAGAALIAAGYPSGHPPLVAAGGAGFLVGVLLLGVVLLVARSRAVNVRHLLPLAIYGFAVAFGLAGGTLGAVIGSGAVRDPASWLALRHAHMVLNVLGWVSLTIAGTLVTLLPTVLRVRMPAWHGAATAALLVGGPALTAVGLALRSGAAAVLGGTITAGGAAGLVWMVGRVALRPRRWPAPVSARHLVLAVLWFAGGSVGLAAALVRGTASFEAFREVFLAAFVGGWMVQTLLGAWLYLLPTWTPAHPDQRRRSLGAIEAGGTVQLAALNAGLVLLALRGAGWVPGTAGSVGMGLTLGGGAIALLKAWTYSVLGRWPFLSARSPAAWGA